MKKTQFYIIICIITSCLLPAYVIGGNPHIWSQIDTDGTSPIIDTANVFSIPNANKIGIFGGYQEAPDITGFTLPSMNVFFNDITLFDASTETWSVVPIAGQKPDERAFSCGVYHEPTNALYVFGGATFANDFGAFSGIPFVFFDDTWKFDFTTNTWSDLSANAGTPPLQRAGSGCTLINDDIYLFSGTTAFFQPTNDLWKFNITSETWVLVEPSDGSTSTTRPVDRSLSNMAAIPGQDQFILAGGDSFVNGPNNPTTQEDIWIYTVSTNSWEQLDTKHKPSVARLHQAFAMTSSNFFLTQNGDAQGDLTPSDTCLPPLACFVTLTPTRDTFFYNIDKEKWKQKHNIGTNLPPTRRSMMAILGDTAYLFGGYNFDGANGNVSQGKIPNEDTYKLKLKKRFIEDDD